MSKQNLADNDSYNILPSVEQEQARQELIRAAKPVCDWLRKYGGDFAYITDDFIKIAYNLTSNMVPKEME